MPKTKKRAAEPTSFSPLGRLFGERYKNLPLWQRLGIAIGIIIVMAVVIAVLTGFDILGVGEAPTKSSLPSLLADREGAIGSLSLPSLLTLEPGLPSLLIVTTTREPTDELTQYFCDQLYKYDAQNMTLIFDYSKNVTIGNYTGKLGGVGCGRWEQNGPYDCVCIWAVS